MIRRNKEIALVTCSRFPRLTPDDRILLRELKAKGIDAMPVVWDDVGVEWGAFDACIVRSTWDYWLKYDRFLSWLKTTAKETEIWNPPAVIKWNSNKGYLSDLEMKGVNVVQTKFFKHGHRLKLDSLLIARGWDRIVVKPAVAGGAYGAFIVDSSNAVKLEDSINAQLRTMDLMVQPFQRSVAERGEDSIIFIGGRYSHSVRRYSGFRGGRPKERQGKQHLIRPEATEMALARKALDAAGGHVLYARVDIIMDNAGKHSVSELELIEPRLFFREFPSAASRMAGMICRGNAL